MMDLNKLQAALNCIPPDCDRDTWIKVGMGLHAECNGADAGLEIWSSWSAGSNQFDPQEVKRQWRSFKSKPGGVAGGTVVALAREHGYRNGSSAPSVTPMRKDTPKPAKDDADRPKKVVARYEYRDATGKLVATKERLEPKDFRWPGGTRGKALPPYGLPRLLEHADQQVFIVEGEKDADRLNAEGVVAISIEAGHEPNAAQFLKGRTVFVIPDNDEGGEKRARAVLAEIPHATVVRLPGLQIKGDVSDWLDDGATVSDLLRLTEDVEIADAGNRLSDAFTLFGEITLNLDREYLVDDVLPATGIATMYGPSGLGKTFSALDLALSVARGIPFANKHETQQGGVVYVALEGLDGVKKRLMAYQRHHQANHADFGLINYALDVCDPPSVDGLVALLDNWKAVRGSYPKLVVIDTLARAMPGRDENSARDMGEVVKGLSTIQKATGGLVLTVHHTGKDEGRGARGHSSHFAALDAVLRLQGDKGDGVKELWVEKLKDGPDNRHVASFRLHQIALGEDRKGREIVSAICRWVDERRAEHERGGLEGAPKQRAIIEHVRQLILDGKCGRYPSATGIPPNTDCVALDDLVERGKMGGDVTSTDDPDDVRRVIRSQLTAMKMKGRIGFFDKKVWLIKGVG